MTSREWPFWWFVPFKEGMFDIRVFSMVGDTMTYIENALVEIIQAGVTVKSGYTDANGKYSTVLGAGTYTIRISKEGYKTIEKTETLSYPTELMVNLPAFLPPEGHSGIAIMSLIGYVINPQISESVVLDKNKVAHSTETISETVSVTVT